MVNPKDVKLLKNMKKLIDFALKNDCNEIMASGLLILHQSFVCGAPEVTNDVHEALRGCYLKHKDLFDSLNKLQR